MTNTHVPLCEECMALTIDDRIIDYVSEDLPYTSRRNIQNQPELKIAFQKHDTLPDLPKLAAAAQAGCQFCAFLMVFVHNCCITYSVGIQYSEFLYNECLEETKLLVNINGIRYVREHDPEATGYATNLPQTGIIAIAADVRIYHETSQERFCETTAWFPVSAKEIPDHLRNPRIGSRPISQQALSKEDLSLITDWIKGCDLHTQCASLTPNQLPTRLIDIGDDKCGKNLCLLNTAEHEDLRDQLSRYVALSYCWGLPSASDFFLKTTPDTLKGFLRSIPYQQMPQTLRDIVETTRKIGLRYIWIDALCIIQDETDQVDWKRECVKMRDVYGNAYLTIAPISSHSSFDGFLSPKEFVYMKVPIRSIKRPELNGICLVREPTTEGRFWQGTLHEDLSDSTWSKRGWTFQEQELSRRILYIGNRTIHFACRTYSWSGDLVESFQGLPSSLRKPEELEWGLLRLADRKEPVLYNNTYQPWYDICSDFSRRIFTNSHDKFPAISGLAEDYTSSLKLAGKEDTYLVGLWENDLYRGLYWAATEPLIRSLSTVLKLYNRPSWAWASYNGSVDWDNYGVNASSFITGRCEITIQSSVFDQNPYNRIEGCLHINGCIESITSLMRIDEFGSHEGLAHVAKKGENIVAECQLDFELEDLRLFSVGFNLSLLLLAESFLPTDGQDITWLVGLLIVQVSELEFARIGIFRTAGKSSLFSSNLENHVVLI